MKQHVRDTTGKDTTLGVKRRKERRASPSKVVVFSTQLTHVVQKSGGTPDGNTNTIATLPDRFINIKTANGAQNAREGSSDFSAIFGITVADYHTDVPQAGTHLSVF